MHEHIEKLTFRKVSVLFMAVHVISEARRCLQCKNPLCRNKGCPIQTNIPEMIRLFLDGKINEAGDMLFENNPLSIMCSLVCDHGAQCEGNCIQGIKGTSVHISSIEHYISDYCLDKMILERDRKKHRRIAVIGSGPAGLTVAIKMAQKGYDVTMFERMDYIGGLLRYGIPDFRLPKTILDRFQKKLLELGILIRPNTSIGGALHLDDLFDDGYEAVFIGTGVWRPRRLGIKGESNGNVHYAIDYLMNPNAYNLLGRKVIVIGAGNSAMDVARTAIRKGADSVDMYVRRNKSAASPEEIDYTLADGVNIQYLTRVESITPDGPMVYHVTMDEEGNVTSQTTPKLVEADVVFIAVSQVPKDKIASTTTGLELNEWGLIKVNEDFMTSKPGVFSAGEVVLGAKTVVAAVREAKISAEGMDKYLQSK